MNFLVKLGGKIEAHIVLRFEHNSADLSTTLSTMCAQMNTRPAYQGKMTAILYH